MISQVGKRYAQFIDKKKTLTSVILYSHSFSNKVSLGTAT